MTIPELIEHLCRMIGEMASIINALSLKLQQCGCMTEGEHAAIEEIQQRIKALDISPSERQTSTLENQGVGRY